MTTLLSVNNYYYARGGAEIVFMRHNRALEEIGWSIVPFSMRHDSNETSLWSAGFVEEIELGKSTDRALTKMRKGLKAVYSMEARRKIRRLIDGTSPDLCHAHNVYHHISPSILSAVRRRGVPLVMTLHDLKIACPAYAMLTHDGVCERCRGGKLYRVATNLCMKGDPWLSALVMFESYLHRLLGSYTSNVDRFVVPSRFYLDKFVEWGFDSSRFDYVPNFVDGTQFEPEFEPGDRFVYFGRLSSEKGLATLVSAAAVTRVGLDIVGSGPLESRLRELAGRLGADVRFHGFLTGKPLRDAITTARAVVVPSEWYENAPLSVLEAFAWGKPVIAAAIGGLPELLADDENGWTFEAGSVASLASRLQHVASLPDGGVREAGMAARQHVVERFSPRRYLDGLRDVYAKLGVEWS